MHRGAPEHLGQEHRGRYAAFLELYRVVHTAQRAGPSPAQGGRGHLHLFRHFIQQRFARGLREELLAPDDHSRNPITLAQGFPDRLEDDVGLLLGVVEQPHDLAGKVHGPRRKRYTLPAAPGGWIDESEIALHLWSPKM